jgi:hypothetical protein
VIRSFAGGALFWAALSAAQAAPLTLEAVIPLPGVSGRIDHMAVDVARRRLIVAELGNGSVEVLDVKIRKVLHRFTGLEEPQGVEYLRQGDLIAVACGGDGTVRFFSAADFSPRGQVALGDDADDARLDPRNGHLLVGFGSGGIAVVDAVARKKIGEVPLPRHPEGFQIRDGKVFVNIPDAGQIVAAELDSNALIARWPNGSLSANFPMALDGAGRRLAVVYRSPARLQLRDPQTGKEIASQETCGDSDDVYFDDKRQRLYVSCGAGVVDVFALWPSLIRLDRIATSRGARTALFVPELDRLFVAERAGLLGSDAAIAIFSPAD